MKSILNFIKLIGKYGGLIIAIMKAIDVLKDEVEKLDRKNED